MDELNFSDSFLDLAYMALFSNACKNKKETEAFNIIREVCEEHGVSMRIYMEMIAEINSKLAELESCDD